MIEFTNDARHSIRQLLVVAAVMTVGYVCTRTLRFTYEGLNIAFLFAFFLTPFVAIRPVLRLHRWPKALGVVLLAPVLSLSVLLLLFTETCEVAACVNHVELSRELGTIRHGHYSVHLVWEETAGGAVGPHGVGLEQRMFICPGLYTVKFLDYFEGAHEGSLTDETGDKVRLRIPKGSGYYGQAGAVDRVYSLKRWVYF